MRQTTQQAMLEAAETRIRELITTPPPPPQPPSQPQSGAATPQTTTPRAPALTRTAQLLARSDIRLSREQLERLGVAVGKLSRAGLLDAETQVHFAAILTQHSRNRYAE